mmetsp:Transcript_41663/g.61158  ORF Transcript_41663/g.61158 Transcript_41663/m.61158 type:complete len:99 (+) Transcript_41663:320-616(+)
MKISCDKDDLQGKRPGDKNSLFVSELVHLSMVLVLTLLKTPLNIFVLFSILPFCHPSPPPLLNKQIMSSTLPLRQHTGVNFQDKPAPDTTMQAALLQI